MADMYPNEPVSNFYEPTIPAERTKEEEKNEKEITDSLPILTKILAWFDEEILKTDKLSELEINAGIPKDALISDVLSQQKLAKKLQNKRDELKDLVRTYQENLK